MPVSHEVERHTEYGQDVDKIPVYGVPDRLKGADGRPKPFIGPDVKAYLEEWKKSVGEGSDEWWAKVSQQGRHSGVAEARMEMLLWLGVNEESQPANVDGDDEGLWRESHICLKGLVSLRRRIERCESNTRDDLLRASVSSAPLSRVARLHVRALGS